MRTRFRRLGLAFLVGCTALSVSSAAGQNGTPTLKIPHVSRASKAVKSFQIVTVRLQGTPK
jgi:hypothetical protein